MEKRAIFRNGLEIREAEDSEELIIRGYFVVFDEITDRVGYYKEKVNRDAFDNVDTSETVLIVGHDFNNLLARSGINLTIEFDDDGGFMEAKLDSEVEYDRLIYNRIKRGILQGMSFGFTIDEMETDFENKIDTIKRVGKLYEITLTPIPAYPQTVATAIERDAEHEAELKREADKEADAEKQKEIDKLLKEIEEM